MFTENFGLYYSTDTYGRFFCLLWLESRCNDRYSEITVSLLIAYHRLYIGLYVFLTEYITGIWKLIHKK